MSLPSDLPRVRAVTGPQIVLALAALGLVYGAGRLQFVALSLAEVSLTQLGQLLATAAFVALLIERAVELILNWRFGPAEIAIVAPLKQAADRNHAQMKMLARDMDLLVSPQDRMTLVDDGLRHSVLNARELLPAQAADTRGRLEDLSLLKKGWATVSAMTLGIGLSLSGFQLLHGALAPQVDLSTLPPLQANVFSFVDICLTSIVLAGGADGIHRLMTRLIDFGKTSRTRIMQD